jgi:drug/metabolite transporter (DMT)-like permease
MGLELWVVLAIAAALAQTTRNAVAQSLAARISPALNSWSRFAFCLPFAALACAVRLATTGAPELPASFFGYCGVTAASQLLGNVALIAAFRAGSFGEAIVFHKLEVILTAIAGALFFAEHPSGLGLTGIFVCGVGVIVINLARESDGDRWLRAFQLGRAGRLALLCAVLLVIASFALKEANRIVADANAAIAVGSFDAPVQTLFHTTWMEVALLSIWIGWREPHAFLAVRSHWRRMLLIGSMGFTASIGWFWAFSLSLVAYVKAVGQIEVLLAVALGIRLLGERTLIRQLPGVALVLGGIALVLLS